MTIIRLPSTKKRADGRRSWEDLCVRKNLGMAVATIASDSRPKYIECLHFKNKFTANSRFSENSCRLAVCRATYYSQLGSRNSCPFSRAS